MSSEAESSRSSQTTTSKPGSTGWTTSGDPSILAQLFYAGVLYVCGNTFWVSGTGASHGSCGGVTGYQRTL